MGRGMSERSQYRQRLREIKERFEQPHEVRKRSLALHRTHSGRKLGEEISNSKPGLVIDLGCGSNEFKRVAPNVIGIDVADIPGVDLVMDIDAVSRSRLFKRRCADWVLCFGPLNYGDMTWATKIGNTIKHLLADEGTAVLHVHPENSVMDWTDSTIRSIGKSFGFRTVSVDVSHTDTSTMTEEEMAVQREVAQRSPDIALELQQGRTLIRPMTTWRWQHL